MLKIEDLVFFDKDGTNYAFSYDTDRGVWTGSILIDRVSRGLVETQRIVLMQRYRVRSESNEVNQGATELVNPVNEYRYGYPSYDTDPSGKYVFEWDTEFRDVDEIRLFGFDGTFCPPEDSTSLSYFEYNCPSVEYADTVAVENLTQYPLNQNPDTTNYTTAPYYEEWTDNGILNSYSTVNISFCNSEDEYNTFRRDLKMYYEENGVRTLVGDFAVFAESVEEDERLTTMCEDLGYGITDEDFKWFKDTDIKEQVEDIEFMNMKRKEILMEGHNIYSYIGSYKSLINVIKFFGYDNVSIREWWRNVDVTSKNYGKYFVATSYSLVDREVIKTDSNISLPSLKFRKTNKLTLAWGIDRVVNIDDQRTSAHSLPEVEEYYEYSIEEAVIKLYGFRRKLEKEFLPLNAHIVDVVGEALGFDYSVVRHNVSDEVTNIVQTGCDCDFSVLPSEVLYIEDLRPFGIYSNTAQSFPQTGAVTLGDIAGETLSSYNTNYVQDGQGHLLPPSVIQVGASASDISGVSGYVHDPDCTQGEADIPINLYGSELYGVYDETHICPWTYYQYHIDSNQIAGNYYLANFSEYYPNMVNNSPAANTFDAASGEYLPDEVGIPVGALLRLQCDNLSTSWDDIHLTWDVCDSMHYSFDNIEYYFRNHSRVSWVVFKPADESPEFVFNVVGTFQDGYGDICVILPYVGKYSVEMRVFGYDNSVSVKYRTDCAEVFPKSVEITGWYKGWVDTLDWSDGTMWKDMDCTWELPVVPNDSVWDEMRNANYEAMDRNTFVGEYYDEEDVNARMTIYEFGTLATTWVGPYFWNNMTVAWDDLTCISWDCTVVNGDIPCYFEFGYFDMNGNVAASPNGHPLTGNVLEIVDGDNNYAMYAFQTPQTQSGETQLEYYARKLNESTNPVISKFRYHVVFDTDQANTSQVTPPNEVDEPNGFVVLAIAKENGVKGDVKYVGINDPQHCAAIVGNSITITDNTQIDLLRFKTTSRNHNPNWIDCHYLHNVKEVCRMTDVNLNYSNCRICGKKNPYWEITNITDPSVPVLTSTRKNFHYVFKDPGCYSVKLTLSDTNGNTYVGERNMFIVK